MSECFSPISTEQLKRPQLTASISISKNFIVNYFPTFRNTIKEINILKEKEFGTLITFSSLTRLTMMKVNYQRRLILL